MFAHGCRVANRFSGPAASCCVVGFGVAATTVSAEKATSRVAAKTSQSTLNGCLQRHHQYATTFHQQQSRNLFWTAPVKKSTTTTSSGRPLLVHNVIKNNTRFPPPAVPKQPSSHPFSSSSTSSSAGSASVSANGGKAAAVPSSGSAHSSFVEWYEGYLESRPVPTKMVTGMFLWSIGDAVAQIVPHLSGQSNKDFEYDWMRTGRAALFGFALHAPASHLHFNFLEWMTHKFGITGFQIPFFKAFMEQFVYWSWISNSMYHAAMGAMQGMSPREIYHRIADVLWDTQKAQWVFWIPIQLLNFQFVPVRHQLNVVLITSIIWTALLSAWYPPIEEENGPEGGEEGDVDKLDQKKAMAAVKPE